MFWRGKDSNNTKVDPKSLHRILTHYYVETLRKNLIALNGVEKVKISDHYYADWNVVDANLNLIFKQLIVGSHLGHSNLFNKPVSILALVMAWPFL